MTRFFLLIRAKKYHKKLQKENFGIQKDDFRFTNRNKCGIMYLIREIGGDRVENLSAT